MPTHKKLHSSMLLTIQKRPPHINMALQPLIPLSPTHSMKRYEFELPEVITTLIHDRKLLSINGWLNPEGDLYSCRFRQHNGILRALNVISESELESKGFIKLTNMKWLVEARYLEKDITEAQKETIHQWFVSNNLDLDNFEDLKQNFSN